MFARSKAAARKRAESAARILARLGCTPNGLTLFGLAGGIAACFLYAWTKNSVLFGLFIFVWGLFDALDGALARVTNKTTKFGAYLDAVCDRAFESAAVLAVAWVSGHWLLCFMALAGGQLVSYAKARAAMEVEIQNNEWPDLMERMERSVVFVTGIILWGLYPKPIFGRDIMFWTLLLLNIAVYATVTQRVLRARRIISSREKERTTPS